MGQSLLRPGKSVLLQLSQGLATIVQQSCNCGAIISWGLQLSQGLQLLCSSRATVVQLSLGFAIISGLATIVQQSCNCCAIISGVCNYPKGLQLLYSSRATVVQLSLGFANISGPCNYCTVVVQ